MADSRPMLLEVEDLKTYFYLDEGVVAAVNGATFSVRRGQTLGVVGESGCGKSVTATSVLRIVPQPGRIVGGRILYHRAAKDGDGSRQTQVIDLATLDPRGKEIRSIRGAEISMVFQEPMTALSPVHTIGNQIIESITLHQGLDEEHARTHAIEMLDRVGMPQPKRTIDRYPFELSGGMRQRAMIAMALACHPSLLMADEPTTALDVTTEAQILQLMRNLQRDLGMAIVFITHNLGVVAQMTEDVIVMYMGKVVEAASVDALFYDSRHPYTRALMRSIPQLGTRSGKPLETISGSVPDPYHIPAGCPYHPRCTSVIEGVCDRGETPQIEVTPGHQVRCHLYCT